MLTSTKSSDSGTKVSIRGKSTKSSAARKRTVNAHSTPVLKSVTKRKRKKAAVKKIKKVAVKKVRKIKAPPRAKLVQYRMSPIELRAIARDVLTNMRQEDIAEMLMLAPRTMRRWLKGDAKIDGSSTALLRMLRAGYITLYTIRAALARPGGAL